MRVIFSFILLSLFLSAQPINEQIHALQDATPEERVELMNNIKKQLVSMNAQRRMLTIETLREQLKHKDEIKHEVNDVDHTAEQVLEDEIETHVEASETQQGREETMTQHEEATHIHNELHQHEYQHEHTAEEHTNRNGAK